MKLLGLWARSSRSSAQIQWSRKETILKKLLIVLGVYYLTVALAFQAAIRVSNMRLGLRAFQNGDELPLALMSAIVPLVPVWPNWREIIGSIVHGEPQLSE